MGELQLSGDDLEQLQIARAVEIGLGVSSPDEIELVGDDEETIAEMLI